MKKRDEFDAVNREAPLTENNKQEQTLDPEREAAKAVSNVYDKHKKELEEELRKLGK